MKLRIIALSDRPSQQAAIIIRHNFNSEASYRVIRMDCQFVFETHPTLGVFIGNDSR